jgi:hypothetical protein
MRKVLLSQLIRIAATALVVLAVSFSAASARGSGGHGGHGSSHGHHTGHALRSTGSPLTNCNRTMVASASAPCPERQPTSR